MDKKGRFYSCPLLNLNMMKKSLLVSFFLLATTFGFAQEWFGVKSSTPTSFQKTLISSTEDEIVVGVKVDGFNATAVKTDKGEQVVISADDMASMLIKGAPDVPMFPIPMIIGDRAEMQVSVIESEYTDFEGIEVAPSKGNFSRQINPDDVEYVYGDMYQQDAFYPATQASLESPYILRDFRGQNLMVYPYAYNPVTKTLRVYTKLVISVNKVGDNGENQKVSRRSNSIEAAPETFAAYERRFINYPSASKYDFIVDEGEMLIVCVDEYMEAVQPLVDWKNISGRPTTMVGVSETGTEDDLKAYIQDYYASHPDLTYLLLVGEHNNLKAHTVPGGRSDNFYGMLEGDDYYEEILVGRLPVNSVQDAENQVAKTIYYERNIDETATWATRAVGIGADEGAGMGHYGEADYEHMDFIRDTLMHYTYTEVSQHYAYINNPTAATMIEDFNTGATVANYCNHGSPTSWAVANFSNSHIHQLTNDNRLPFIWSVACNNGQFDYDECFGEAWMRATNSSTGAPTGAIGGMFSWISQPWLPPMFGQDEMNAILTEWRDGYKHTLGGVSVNGNQYVLDMAPGDAGSTHNTWLLFGDPSLMVRTDVPQNMNVTASPSVLLLGMTSLTVNADAEFGIATLSMDGEAIASAYVNNGVAELSFPALANVGTAKLVVVGYNRVTTEMDIMINPAEGAFLVNDGYVLNDDNGQLDYGENIKLSINVENVGVEQANDISVELTTDSEYITLNDNTETIDGIAAGETITLEEAFDFDVASNVPDQTTIEFVVVYTSGSDVWESKIIMKANAPKLKSSSIALENNVMPGETGKLILVVNNDGHSDAHDLVAELTSSSSELQFTNVSLSSEDVAAGENVTIEAEFDVASSVLEGTLIEVGINVAAGHYTMNSVYNINVGNVTEGFETGDFSAYDWQFSGSAQWTVTSNYSYEGTYSAKSGAIGNSESSSLTLTIEVLSDGEMSFYCKVNSESGYDKLIFYIDNVPQDDWSGDVSWSLQTFQVTQGTHTFEWKYSKDISQSSGEDCAYIDNITFPPVSVVELLDPIAELKAEVNGNTVTLDWTPVDDAEYIIKRDGAEIATTSSTTYEDVLDGEGIYMYSVVAKVGDFYSLPAIVTVTVGTVDIIEIESVKFDIYPNPTTGIVNVGVNTVFDANVYNYQGQIVMRLTDNNGQIDMSALPAGLYLLEIRANDKVAVEKIILK